MRDLVDLVAGAIYSLRILHPAQLVLRLLALLTILGAAALALLWFPQVVVWPALAIGIAGAALWNLLLPDSFGSLVAIGILVIWWLAGAGGAAWWQMVVMALLLAIHHLTSGYAAAAPSYSGISRRGVRQLLAWGLAFAGASVVGIALVLGIAALPADVIPRGFLWVALGLLGLVGAGVVATYRRVS